MDTAGLMRPHRGRPVHATRSCTNSVTDTGHMDRAAVGQSHSPTTTHCNPPPSLPRVLHLGSWAGCLMALWGLNPWATEGGREGGGGVHIWEVRGCPL